MEQMINFLDKYSFMRPLISIVFVAMVCLVLYVVFKEKALKLTTKHVVAIGIGSALYAATSMISINVAPNTGLRIAISLLCVFGALFGPIVGFLVGFIGHALNDAISSGVVWWSWVFMSASVGLFSGFITLQKDFNVLKGKLSGKHIVLMYIYSIGGALVGSILSYCGDVFLYGEPANKVWLQIIVANALNLLVIAVVGIPVVIGLAKLKNTSSNLEEE